MIKYNEKVVIEDVMSVQEKIIAQRRDTIQWVDLPLFIRKYISKIGSFYGWDIVYTEGVGSLETGAQHLGYWIVAEILNDEVVEKRYLDIARGIRKVG